MASASKAIRQKRRIRRNLSLVTRAYREEALNRVKVQTILLTILAQHGGEIVVTQDGLNSAVASLGKAQYVVEPLGDDKKAFAVRLVTTEDDVVLADPSIGESTESVERPE
jgi:hypothetical protein